MEDPQGSEGRLRWMVEDPGLVRTLMGMRETRENTDALLFSQFIERVLRGGDKKNSRSQS